MTEKESSNQLWRAQGKAQWRYFQKTPASYFCYFLNPDADLDKIRIRCRLSLYEKQETVILKLLYVPGVFPEVYSHT